MAQERVTTSTDIISTQSWEPIDDVNALEMLQNILLLAAEGVRDASANNEYKQIRKWVMANIAIKLSVPEFVISCRDLPAFWSYIKTVDDQWEPRRRHIRTSFASIFEWLEEDHRLSSARQSATWTGISSKKERLVAAKAMLPVAQAALENLINDLQRPGSNGGPPLDEHVEALDALRMLHGVLGEVIVKIEDGAESIFNGDGLLAEASRYARRAARSLKADPVPYAVAGLVLTILSSCGFPGVGGFLSGIASNMRKNVRT